MLVLRSAAYNAYSNNAYNVLELPNPTWVMKAVCCNKKKIRKNSYLAKLLDLLWGFFLKGWLAIAKLKPLVDRYS